MEWSLTRWHEMLYGAVEVGQDRERALARYVPGLQQKQPADDAAARSSNAIRAHSTLPPSLPPLRRSAFPFAFMYSKFIPCDTTMALITRVIK